MKARWTVGVALVLLALHLQAATLESLIMPGPVIAGHADTESECAACHEPFSREREPLLCQSCHEQISEDIALSRGLHGLEAAGDRHCRDCHTEHKGRDADITGLVVESFDHRRTGFELLGAHAAAGCTDCHADGAAFREADPVCTSCHERDDPHRGNLGSDCSSCHTPITWRETSFDHGTDAGLELRGAHVPLACDACHADQIFEGTASECIACHALDDVHKGQRGKDCGSCHGESEWQESKFDHAASTGFELRGGHAMLSCTSCHSSSGSLDQPPTTCAGCHSVDDPHRGQRGSDCAACHREDSWDVAFDHLGRTGFALTGAHADLSCQSCHLGSLEDPLPSDCEDCHAADDPHRDQLTVCGDCHDANGWRGTAGFDHEFTNFPLLGLHRLAGCEQCHASLAFKDAGESCDSCHSGNDHHRSSLGTDCARCHGPSGWDLWTFDHELQTGFALTGAHADLACEGCHEPGTAGVAATPTRCAGCHLRDDVHAGQFGNRCERCHTTEAFTNGRLLQ